MQSTMRTQGRAGRRGTARGAATPRLAAPRLPSLRVVATATVDKAAAAPTQQPHGRIFNFSAGPANLPLEVRAAAKCCLPRPSLQPSSTAVAAWPRSSSGQGQRSAA